jgi:GT2 family glycosyltransferase
MKSEWRTEADGHGGEPDGTSSQGLRVFILLLNWNNWKDTNECLNSLERLDYDEREVIVLDNGSTDGSVERIREEFPEVEIIQLKANLGFSAGNNAGIKVALERGAEYVWLLNNDTTVSPKALKAMVEKAEADRQIGAVGSTIYYANSPERLQAWGGGHVNFWLGRSRHFQVPVADREIEFLTGASILLRASTVKTLGLWDEDYFLYWEDADYCFRLRNAGWRLGVAGDSKVWHKEQASVGKNSQLLDMHFNRSAARFFARHSPIPIFSTWAGICLRIGKRVIAGDWERARAVWAGVKRADIKA